MAKSGYYYLQEKVKKLEDVESLLKREQQEVKRLNKMLAQYRCRIEALHDIESMLLNKICTRCSMQDFDEAPF